MDRYRLWSERVSSWQASACIGALAAPYGTRGTPRIRPSQCEKKAESSLSYPSLPAPSSPYPIGQGLVGLEFWEESGKL